MPKDTKVNPLIINTLTQAQYDEATKNANEIYLTPEQPASTTNLGPVKVDGSTITVTEDGTISATKQEVDLSDCVKKSGDTMTNTLTVSQPNIDSILGAAPTTTQYGSAVQFDDKAHNSAGNIGTVYESNGIVKTRMLVRRVINGTSKFGEINVGLDTAGLAIATAPHPVSAANGNEIATTQWVRNQSVAKSGDTMTGRLTLNSNSQSNLIVKDNRIERGVAPASNIYTEMVEAFDKNDKRVASVEHAQVGGGGSRATLQAVKEINGENVYAQIHVGFDSSNNIYAACPNPVANSNSNTIATTKWVRDLINDYVIESFKDNSGSWYRKYKSGWLEQGGVTPALEIPLTPSSAVTTVTFLKPFSKIYSCHVSPSSWASSVVMDFGGPLSSTVSNTIWARSITNAAITVDKGVQAIWYAAGQGA